MRNVTRNRYTYYLVRGDGTFLIKRRVAGDSTVQVTNGWTPSDAVVKADSAGQATNQLGVVVAGGTVTFLANGKEVYTARAAGLDTQGLVCYRVNHKLEGPLVGGPPRLLRRRRRLPQCHPPGSRQGPGHRRDPQDAQAGRCVRLQHDVLQRRLRGGDVGLLAALDRAGRAGSAGAWHGREPQRARRRPRVPHRRPVRRPVRAGWVRPAERRVRPHPASPPVQR